VVVGRFVADFAAASVRLVVEVDGSAHARRPMLGAIALSLGSSGASCARRRRCCCSGRSRPSPSCAWPCRPEPTHLPRSRAARRARARTWGGSARVARRVGASLCSRCPNSRRARAAGSLPFRACFRAGSPRSSPMACSHVPSPRCAGGTLAARARAARARGRRRWFSSSSRGALDGTERSRPRRPYSYWRGPRLTTSP
jgi:hypothetical protein